MTVSAHLGQSPRTPLQALGARWVLGVVLALVGLAVGGAIALSMPTTYTAEARVAVNAGGLSAGAVAGLPLAASQLASNYARYVNDQALAGEGAQSVAASPIPDSNVIRVEGSSDTSRQARQVAQAAATSLIAKVEKSSGGSDTDLLAAYSKAAQISAGADQRQQEAQSRLSALRAADASSGRISSARADVLVASQRAATASLREDALATRYQNAVGSLSAAQLNLIQPAVLSGSDRTGRLGRYGILGLVLGLAAALVIATLRERRLSRRR